MQPTNWVYGRLMVESINIDEWTSGIEKSHVITGVFLFLFFSPSQMVLVIFLHLFFKMYFRICHVPPNPAVITVGIAFLLTWEDLT